MHYLYLIIPFLILTGIALLFSNLIKLNIGEGMILALPVVILITRFSGGAFRSFAPGIVLLFILALAGIALEILICVKRDTIFFGHLISWYWFSLILVLVLSLVIYTGAHIQALDELYYWASILKRVLTETRAFPKGMSVFGGGSTAFHIFFLYFTDYNEGLVYVSAALLYWIGLLLPIGDLRINFADRAIMYVVTMHFALFVLYYFGTKSLCLELPFACLAGGLGAWCVSRRRKLRELSVLGAGILLLFMIGGSSALLFGVIVTVLFFMRRALSPSPGEPDDSFFPAGSVFDKASIYLSNLFSERLYNIILIAVLGVTLLVVGIFTGINTVLTERTTMESAAIIKSYGTHEIMSFGTFLAAVFGSSLSSASTHLRISLIGCLILSSVLIMLLGYKRREPYIPEMVVIALFGFGAFYLMTSFNSLLGDIGYGVVIQKYEIPVVLSVYAVFAFVTAFGWLMTDRKTMTSNMPRYIGCILVLVFLYCTIDKTYIPYTTAFSPVSLAGYADIFYTDMQVSEIREKIDSSDKVYLIDQGSSAGKEYVASDARYHLGSKVSDYRKEPWRFTAGGSFVSTELDSGITVLDLPDYLSKGRYKYVWIYKTDDYLNEMLPRILGYEEFEQVTSDKDDKKDDEKDLKDYAGSDEANEQSDAVIQSDSITNGQLYKVVYNKKGKAVRLEFVKNIHTYDNRNTYYKINNIK